MTPQTKVASHTERIFTHWLRGRALWAAMFAMVLLSSAYTALVVAPAHRVGWPGARPVLVFVVWGAVQCGFGLVCVAKVRFERRANKVARVAERERRRSENPSLTTGRYRDLFENVSEMIAVAGAEGRYIYVNPAWEQCFGRGAEEAAMLPGFAAAFPPAMQGQARALFERALAGERIEEYPLRFSAPDGKMREIEASLYCRPAAKGISAVRCIFRDVTQRNQRERRLAMQVGVSQILQEATNTEGALPRILEALGRHLGFDLVQLWRVTPDFGALRHGTLWMAEDCVFTGALERSGRIEFAPGEALPGIVWSSGAPLWVENIQDDALFAPRAALLTDGLATCWGVPVRSGNRVIAVIEFFSRTRQRENAELRTAVETVCASIGQFLARSAEEKRVTELNRQKESILNTVADGILGTDQHGRVTFANPAAAAMLGATPNGLIGRFVHAIVHEDTCKEGEVCSGNCRLRQGFFTAGNASGRDVFYRPGGGSFPVEFSLTPMYVQGAAAGRVLHFRDVSQREELDRMKDEFIATVSHELRTPLTSIRGALGLLSAGLVGNLNAKAENLLKIAVSNSDRLVRLINDVLDLERMQSGRAPLNIRRVAPGELAQQAMDAMAPVADAANVRLELEAEALEVDADPDRLQQVMLNLLSNAIKFSPPQSRVTVRLVETAEGVALSVEDEGRGIPEEKLEAIFDRFQQVDVSDSRQKGGTGLGLAICRTIVNQHGGRIWAERNAGRGATLRVLLPGGRPEVEAAKPEHGAILICDDDAEMRAVLGNSLRSRGYTVYEAATGQEAITVAQSHGLDAILLDLGLPDMNGWQALRMLKDEEATADVPVVMLGGQSGRLEEHLEAPEGWLAKPASGEELMRELARVMDGGAEPACVLLVEDDEDLARVVMANFDRVGIAVHHAGTRAAAIEFCRRRNPDLLILDLALPDGNGFELVEWLRQEQRLRGLPLVVYSGREVSGAERARLRLGPAEFLNKSHVQPAEMESLVRTMLWRYGGTSEVHTRIRMGNPEARDGQDPWNAAF